MTINFTHILGSELTLYVEGELWFEVEYGHLEEKLELTSAKVWDEEGEDMLPYLNEKAQQEIIADYFTWRNA